MCSAAEAPVGLAPGAATCFRTNMVAAVSVPVAYTHAANRTFLGGRHDHEMREPLLFTHGFCAIRLSGVPVPFARAAHLGITVHAGERLNSQRRAADIV